MQKKCTTTCKKKKKRGQTAANTVLAPIRCKAKHKAQRSELTQVQPTYDIWVGAVLVGTVFKMRKYYRVSITHYAIFRAWRNARKKNQYLTYEELLTTINTVLADTFNPFFSRPKTKPIR